MRSSDGACRICGLADMAVDQNLRAACFHLPGSAIGTLTHRGNGDEFSPL